MITDILKPYLKPLGIQNNHQVFSCMQMSAILGTSIILRQVLNQSIPFFNFCVYMYVCCYCAFDVRSCFLDSVVFEKCMASLF